MKLNPNRVKPTEHEVMDFCATVEVGTTPDDVLKPEFFANVAPRLTPYSKIRVRVDDGSWYAELLVLSVGRTWAKTISIFHINLVSNDVEQTMAEYYDAYKVQFRGPHAKWSVVRKEDGSVIKEHIDTKKEADTWLADYTRTVS